MIASDLGVWENSGLGGGGCASALGTADLQGQAGEGGEMGHDVGAQGSLSLSLPGSCWVHGCASFLVSLSSPFPCLCVHRHHAVELALSLSSYPDTAIEAALVDGAGGGGGGSVCCLLV